MVRYCGNLSREHGEESDCLITGRSCVAILLNDGVLIEPYNERLAENCPCYTNAIGRSWLFQNSLNETNLIIKRSSLEKELNEVNGKLEVIHLERNKGTPSG